MPWRIVKNSSVRCRIRNFSEGESLSEMTSKKPLDHTRKLTPATLNNYGRAGEGDAERSPESSRVNKNASNHCRGKVKREG